MKKREYIFVALVVTLGIALVWQQVRLMAQGKITVQPMQIFSCSATDRDIRVKMGEDENIKKGIWKESERETLDQIVQDNDLGLHSCIAFDPTLNKRFVIVFDGTGYQGHTSVAIIEEK